jgi:hypothetical protein
MIIHTTEELSVHLPITISFDFDIIRSDIKRAEDAFLKPYLGESMYSILNNWTIDKPEDIRLEKLYEFAAPVVAKFAYSYYLPKSAVQTSSAGIHRIETETERSLYKYQYIELEKSAKADGYQALETMLMFLEKTADKYPEWAYSKEVKDLRESLLPESGLFNFFVPISNSSVLFWHLKNYIVKEQKEYISKRLGENLLNRLISQDEAETKDLLYYSRKVLALRSLQKAFPYLNISYGEGGFFMPITTAAEQNLEAKGAPLDNRLELMMMRINDELRIAINELASEVKKLTSAANQEQPILNKKDSTTFFSI